MFAKGTITYIAESNSMKSLSVLCACLHSRVSIGPFWLLQFMCVFLLLITLLLFIPSQSSSLNLFGHTVENNLMPVSYGHVSGGHPDAIPTLTWDALRKFHSDFYHPSNAKYVWSLVTLAVAFVRLQGQKLHNRFSSHTFGLCFIVLPCLHD